MGKIIKKYQNRRLYDTEKSRYITLDALKEEVMQGINFKVQDAKTGADLTQSVLLQILVEIQSGPTPFLSSDVLKQLIKFADHPLHKHWKTMLEQATALLENTLQSNPYAKNCQEKLVPWMQKYQDFMKQWSS